MCGRFSLSSNLEELKSEFSNEVSGNFPEKYNISVTEKYHEKESQLNLFAN